MSPEDRAENQAEYMKEVLVFNKRYHEKVHLLFSRAEDKIVDELSRQVAQAAANEDYTLAENRLFLLGRLVEAFACLSGSLLAGDTVADLEFRHLPTQRDVVKDLQEYYLQVEKDEARS